MTGRLRKKKNIVDCILQVSKQQTKGESKMVNREKLIKEIDKLRSEIREKQITANFKDCELAHLIEDSGESYAKYFKNKMQRRRVK